MENGIPNVEFWTVVKWVVIVIFVFGLKEFSGLIVKKWWYGAEKHTRRKDGEEAREWINRFLENQHAHTEAMIKLDRHMGSILNVLHENGRKISEFTERAECKFEHNGRH